MRLIPFIILILLTQCVLAQEASIDTIKVKLVANKEVIRGATLYIRGSKPPLGTITDIDGLATLLMPRDKQLVEINFLGPYVELEILRPVDSIYFDLEKKQATYYLDHKKVKRKKQIVRGY